MKYSIRTVTTVCATIVFLVHAWIAAAAELTVLSAVVMKPVLGELVTEFERATGHKITVDFATAGVLRNRIQGGEIADTTILPRPMMDALRKDAKVIRGSEVVLAYIFAQTVTQNAGF